MSAELNKYWAQNNVPPMSMLTAEVKRLYPSVNDNTKVTKDDIDKLVREHDGYKDPGPHLSYVLSYRIPTFTGGSFNLSVVNRPRWCGVYIDRWFTTDRDMLRFDPWVNEFIRPLAFLKASDPRWLYSHGKIDSMVTPIDRRYLIAVLQVWINAELKYSLPANSLKHYRQLTRDEIRRRPNNAGV